MKALIQATAEIYHVLVMNMMRNRTESATEVAKFESKEAAIAFIESEKVPAYIDPGPGEFDQGTVNFNKGFRKGGPLEWFNQLSDSEIQEPNRWGHGIHRVITLLDEPEIIRQLP